MIQTLRSFVARVIRTTIALALIAICYSCEKNIPFEESIIVPAAQGNVTIKKDNNNNYAISIKIFNLAEVGRLQPAKSFYLIWVETEQHEYKNVGQIDSEKNLISNKLKAKFETVTSFKPVKIFITAENELDPQRPAKQIILATKFF